MCWVEAVGVTKLYSHQKEAIHASCVHKRSVVVATPTASGNSLAYTVPLLRRLGEKRSARALVLFPLKALANDQLAKLRKFPEAAERLADSGKYSGTTLKKLRSVAAITVRTLDGDTKESDRDDQEREDPAAVDQPRFPAPLPAAGVPE